METNNNKDEIEIDIMELIFVILDKIWLILAVGIVSALLVALYSKLLITPMYTSTTKLYVINRQNTETTTLSDLQTGTQLTKDYVVLVKNRPVIEAVIEKLNLNMDYEDLLENISVNAQDDTRVIEINVKDKDPDIARQIADTIADESSTSMAKLMDIDKPGIVEPGNLPTKPSSPNIAKNTLIGGIIGIFVTVFAVLLIYILNDTIKSADDVERYLELNTLGTIPLEEGVQQTTKKKRMFFYVKKH